MPPSVFRYIYLSTPPSRRKARKTESFFVCTMGDVRHKGMTSQTGISDKVSDTPRVYGKGRKRLAVQAAEPAAM